MTNVEALALHAKFLELKALVEAKLPKEQIWPHPWMDGKTARYEFDYLDLESLTAYYRTYIGRGEYETSTDRINLETLEF